MTQLQPAEALRLDVREVLASGGEPFDLILSAAGQVPPGGTLELTAPFEPVPLYRVMADRGFVHITDPRGPAEWVVTFRATGIVPGATVAEVAAQHPATQAVFARHGLDLCCGGGKTLEFVARAHGIELAALLDELRGVAGK